VHTCFLSAPERPRQTGDYTRLVHVSEGYFETIGTPILAGRGIAPADRAGTSKVVVLSQTAARTLFGGANPIGRLVSTFKTFESKDALQVVGVAHDVRFNGPGDPFGFVLYVPIAQDPAPVTSVLLRTTRDPARLAPTVRAAFRQVDPTLFVGSIAPLSDSLESHLGNEKLVALLSACFGLLSLALTCVGVYGVVAYAVQRRNREIGIRLALGATGAAVSRMVMRDLALLAAAGALLGIAGAIAATRALRSMLFAFGPSGYSLLLGAAALLLLVTAAAGYLPARRAARLDPMTALRQQ
jgi:hypothetical protein